MNIRREKNTLIIIAPYKKLNSTLKKLKLPPFSLENEGKWKKINPANLFLFEFGHVILRNEFKCFEIEIKTELEQQINIGYIKSGSKELENISETIL
jgi:hypothetical protein